MCALCYQKCSTITGCGECQEHYSDEYIDARTCEEKIVSKILANTRVTHIDIESSYFAFCGVLCREGLPSTLGQCGGLF